MKFLDETNTKIAKEEYKERDTGFVFKTDDEQYIGHYLILIAIEVTMGKRSTQ